MTDIPGKNRAGVSFGLGEGSVDLNYEEGVRLAHLRSSPGWPVLRMVLEELNNGCTVALRDREKNLEDLRFCQGQADAAGRIADIVEKECPQWYAEGAAERESAEGSGEDDG
jgi:hypothetical protein